MKPKTVPFLIVVCMLHIGSAFSQETQSTSRSTLNPVERAALHPIILDRPAIDFFDGALLGNGGLGAVVTTRPDAVIIHLGHNDVWDIRHTEHSASNIETFAEVYDHIRQIPASADSLMSDSWYQSYYNTVADTGTQQSPEPFPCGSLVLDFDPREAELIGHYVHINSGFCEVDFLIDGELAHLQLFVDMNVDRLWGRMVDEAGNLIESPFHDISLVPDPDTPSELPHYETVNRNSLGMLGFRQILPSGDNSDIPDRAFALKAWVNGRFLTATGNDNPALIGEINPDADFIFCLQLDNGNSETISLGTSNMPATTSRGFLTAANETVTRWELFWYKSGIQLDDEALERTWYQNLYLLRCALGPDGTLPGVFANWRYRDIGTGPNSVYSMDYRTQQSVWALFSTNHTELHAPYVGLIESYLHPLGQTWAQTYYSMNGAAFPKKAYPIPMSTFEEPLPDQAWEIAVTPWTTQSLWWQFMYTMDLEFLRNHAMPVIRDSAHFLADYISNLETPDIDDRISIFPSVAPGLHELTPGLSMNSNLLPDLTLTKFVFFAYLESCQILGMTEIEQDLIHTVHALLDTFPSYPTAETLWGDVYVTTSDEDPETLYNTPSNMMTIFPGEEHGLHSSEEIYRRAVRTYLNHRSEGASDLVFLNMIGARLGMLDLDRFVRQIEYCRTPNGACTRMALQSDSALDTTEPFDIHAGDGIWLENLSLPAVINECLIQSYSGLLRLFPNWPSDTDGEFRTLRAAGAFLVSAKFIDGTVAWIEITSEAGAPLSVLCPWPDGAIIVARDTRTPFTGSIIELATSQGEVVTLLPPK